jgi:hypothetical protein
MAEFADNPNPEDQEVPDEVAAMFDLKKKKKKKKKVDAETADAAGDNEVAEGGSTSADQAAKGDSDLDPPRYTYTDLLNRVVDLLHANNPDLVEKRRYTMKPPQLMRGILRAIFLCRGGRKSELTVSRKSLYPITTNFPYSRH